MDFAKYAYFASFDNDASVKYPDSFNSAIWNYGKYAARNGDIINIYDPTESYAPGQINNRDSGLKDHFLTSNFYSYISPAGDHTIKDKIEAVEPTEEQNASMNILQINSGVLTKLFPWNVSVYLRKNVHTGEIVPQSYLPLHSEQFSQNSLTVLKLLALGYSSWYVWKNWRDLTGRL
jgi:hypothetical protein